MLRLIDIQRVRQREPEHVYLVTLDRDGKTTRYEFTWNPPPESRPGLPSTVDEPMEVIRDLLDYSLPPPDDKFSHGALIIPALSRIIQTIYRIADGKSFDFPIVLDER